MRYTVTKSWLYQKYNYKYLKITIFYFYITPCPWSYNISKPGLTLGEDDTPDLRAHSSPSPARPARLQASTAVSSLL